MAGLLALGLVGLGLHAVPAALAETGTGGLVAVPAPAASDRRAPATPAPDAPPADPAPKTAPAPEPEPERTEAKPAKIVSVPATGPGTYVHANRDGVAAGSSGSLIRFDVRVEDNLELDADEAAELIEGVLNDKRSWRGTGRWRFELVDSAAEATLHAYLVTPGTTDQLCAPLLTRGEVSCQNGNRVVLNAKRWMLGADAYGTDVDNYRRYLVNHEFGHSLGHQHVQCPAAGKPAPVMMQQTKGLGGCRKNPWPLGSGD